jgi:hypothetical protein
MSSSIESFEHFFAVRVRPSGESEYLYRIVVADKIVRIVRMESIHGSVDLYLSKLLNEGADKSPERLAAAVKVSEDRLELPLKDFESVQARFRRSAACSVGLACDIRLNNPGQSLDEEVVIIHGTTYEIRYVSSRRESLQFRI